jgi:hypothetical protein
MLSLLLVAGIAFTTHMKLQKGYNGVIGGMDAVQVPLKTSVITQKDFDFKKEWETKQTKEALGYIKR